MAERKEVPDCYGYVGCSLYRQPPGEIRRGRHSRMNEKVSELSERYVASLRTHMKRRTGASSPSALKLGRQAVALGLETLEMAGMHERAVVTLGLSHTRNGLIGRARVFFLEAIIPILETHRTARQSKIDLLSVEKTLKRRTAELAATNLQLRRDILRRKSMEAALKRSGEHYAKLLRESRRLQESLRRLAHQVLAAQEDERKNISHELQDEIAQTLLGIKVRLLSLKQEARSNTKELRDEIASTQRLVVRSARSVRRVARQFKKK